MSISSYIGTFSHGIVCIDTLDAYFNIHYRSKAWDQYDFFNVFESLSYSIRLHVFDKNKNKNVKAVIFENMI